MRVLVTGAAGFIGRRLVERLLAQGLDGHRLTRLVAVDLPPPAGPGETADVRADPRGDSGADARMVTVDGSIAEPAVLDLALASPVDVAFHLASVPGGAAERAPDLARRVNLDATLQLVDRLRDAGTSPRLVFASTVAVYGDPLPEFVDEDTPARPALSYGAHKLAAEVLIADATRRGWVRGCSLRLPGVVARPGDGAGLISAFMSRLFWALQAGEPLVLPVTADGRAWWISVEACVDNLLHAATIDPFALGPRSLVQMPALHLSMRDVIDALCRAHGEDRRALVSHAPDAAIQRLFASYPPLLTPRAEAWGFRHDGNADALVRRATGSA